MRANSLIQAHVAGQRELVADAARPAANPGDAHNRRGREAQHKVAPKTQHLRPFSCPGYVEMGDEEIGVRRLEHYNFHGRVRLEVGHQREQFEDGCRNKHVDRWVAEGDRPPARTGAVGVELQRVRHGASPPSIGRSALRRFTQRFEAGYVLV
jgi:hypothetical protein